MNVEEIKKVRAKSDGTTLLEHTNAVIETGLKLLQVLALSDCQRKFLGEYFVQTAILHDLGKVHPVFQKMLDKCSSDSVRHELVSVWFVETYLEVTPFVLFAVGTHHKGVVSAACGKSLDMSDLNSISIDIDDDGYLSSAEGVMCKETLQSWLSLFSEQFQFKAVERDNIPASSCYLFRERKQTKVLSRLSDRQKCSLLRAFLQVADHLASAGQEDIPAYQLINLEDFQPHSLLETFPFRHFQEVLQQWRGDVVLHAPTGSGKTEAALSWVYANQSEGNRLFYLLPYTASINAMMMRLRQVYKETDVMIQHSKSLNFIYNELCEECSNIEPDYQELERKARNINSLSREVFYPVKIMTLHQLLRVTCHGKGWEYSMLDCQNALFIVDEFHAYNAFLTGKLLGTAKVFRRFFNAKFMFMSATISDFMLNQIIEKVYDGDVSKILRPDVHFDSDAVVMGRKRHHLICHKSEDIAQYIGQIEADLEQGLSVLVIVNNVKTCQRIYQEIDCEESEKMMLHGGFNQRSRKIIEQAITCLDKEKRPRLLVATQAVEVSLDIDYNTAYIENAPVDSLIQRFGRVNRAGRLCDEKGNKRMADIHLFQNILGRTPFYDEQILYDTWNSMLKLDGKDLSEDDLINACNEVYHDGYSDVQMKDFIEGYQSVLSFDQEWVAGISRDWADEILDKANQKVDVLCYNLKEDYLRLIEEKRYIEANELLVSVYPYHRIRPSCLDVLVVEDLFYDEKKGCVEAVPDCYEIM